MELARSNGKCAEPGSKKYNPGADLNTQVGRYLFQDKNRCRRRILSRIISRKAVRRYAHAGNGRLGKTDLLLDFMGQAALPGREGRIVREQSRVAKDGGKRIVDLVSGTRG